MRTVFVQKTRILKGAFNSEKKLQYRATFLLYCATVFEEKLRVILIKILFVFLPE